MDQSRRDRVATMTTGDASRRGLMKAMLGSGVLAMGLASGQSVAAQASPGTCPPGTPEENIALVTRFLTEVWTAGGDAVVDELLAPDEINHWGVGDDTVGKEEFAKRLRNFLAAFPDIAIRIDQTIATDEFAVARYTVTATHQGQWLGIAPTGRTVTWTGIDIFRISCGKITENWGEDDHLRLLQELGGVPGRATPIATPTS